MAYAAGYGLGHIGTVAARRKAIGRAIGCSVTVLFAVFFFFLFFFSSCLIRYQVAAIPCITFLLFFHTKGRHEFTHQLENLTFDLNNLTWQQIHIISTKAG